MDLHVEIYINNSLTLIMSINALKVFVGKSIKNQMTTFCGGYGPEFDGNSILLEVEVNKYIYTGSSIFEFITHDEIVTFISNVGINDVPYPYAIDCNDTYYLLEEKVVAHYIHPPFESDPYRIYYDKHNIITIDTQKQYKGLIAFFIGDDPYNLTYMSNPSKSYNLCKTISEHIVIEKENGTKYDLSKQEYCDIINEFGNIRDSNH